MLLIDGALEAAAQAGYRALTTRIDGAEYAALQSLTARGFVLVDSSVKMSVGLDDVPPLAGPSRAGGMRIRPFQPADTKALIEIASTDHAKNHYFNDPALPADASARMMGRWIEECCQRPDARAFVLDHHERVDGFAVYLAPGGFNRAMNARLLALDFVCLSRRVRGSGLGRWLLSDTMRRMAEEFRIVELRTSHHNYPALACYHSLGMRVISTDFILHRHAG